MKILIIGLGSIARKHIQAIFLIKPESKIFALRKSSNDKIDGVENIFSIDTIKEKLDFVIISNPTQLHALTILESIKLNCPIFIEKPVLSDLISAELIRNEIYKSNLITYVSFNLRFHPAIVFLKNYLDKTNLRINEVNVYCGSYLPDWRGKVNFRKVYSANKNMGGGVHLDLIHEIDYSIWLFGQPKEVNSFSTSTSSLEIDSVDYAQYNLIYEKFVLNIKLNYFRRDTKREIEIVAENETLLCDLQNCVIKNLVNDTILYTKKYNIMETYIAQMNYFIDIVNKGCQPMNSFEESLNVLKIALNDKFTK